MSSPWVQQLLHRLSQWLPRRSQKEAPRLAARGKVRIAVSPPALQPWAASDADMGNWQVSSWLDSSHARAVALNAASAMHHGAAARKRITPLPEIRREFLAALRDLPRAECEELEACIRASRSLRELWHLRPALFKLVALHRDQHAAQNRLGRLNRHFPSDALGRNAHPLASLHPLRTAP